MWTTSLVKEYVSRKKSPARVRKGAVLSMSGNIWWIGPIVLVLMRLLYVEGLHSKASTKGSATIFRAGVGLPFLTALGISTFVVLIITSLGREEGWVIAGASLLTVLLALGWPSTIVLDEIGVSRHLWWKPAVTIPWGSVVELDRGAVGDWTVYGSDGKTISFTRYHRDAGRFEAEVRRRANINRSKHQNSPTTLT